MDKRDGAADLLVLERAEPTCLRGGVLLNPRSDGLDYQHIGETGDYCLSAGPQRLGFGSHEAQHTLNPLHVGELDASMQIILGRSLTS
jgi:hypothetical protein